MSRPLTAGILAAALIATAACGKSAEQKQAEETAKAISEAAKTGADSMAAGAAAMAKGFEQLGKASANTNVVEFEVLGSSFPDVSGWTRAEITGSTTNVMGKMSQAQTSYKNGEKRVRLEAVDAALAQMMMMPISMALAANYSERSSDGYKKGITLKGEPGFEDVNTKNETADLTVVVGKRFIVTAKGSNGASIDDVRSFVEKMDFGKLK